MTVGSVRVIGNLPLSELLTHTLTGACLTAEVRVQGQVEAAFSSLQ